MNVFGITIRISPEEREKVAEMLPRLLPDMLSGTLAMVLASIRAGEPTGEKEGDLLFSSEARIVPLNSVEGQNIRDGIESGDIPDLGMGDNHA